MAVSEQPAEKIADTQCGQHRRDQRGPRIDAASEIRTQITRSEHFETHHDRAGEEGDDVDAERKTGKRPTSSALVTPGRGFSRPLRRSSSAPSPPSPTLPSALRRGDWDEEATKPLSSPSGNCAHFRILLHYRGALHKRTMFRILVAIVRLPIPVSYEIAMCKGPLCDPCMSLMGHSR